MKISSRHKRIWTIICACLSFLLLLGGDVGAVVGCPYIDRLRDTYVRAWFPDQENDRSSQLWLRPGCDFVLFSFDEPAGGIEFHIVQRTNNQPITISAYRLHGSWPDKLTYRAWETMQSTMFGPLLDSIEVTDIGVYALSLHGAQNVILVAEGGGVGYAIASSESNENGPIWYATASDSTTTPLPPPVPTEDISTPVTVTKMISMDLKCSSIYREYSDGTISVVVECISSD